MSIREALAEKGQLVLREPLALPDGARVTVRVEEPGESPLLEIARNAVDMGVEDGSEQNNHYVYGTPKRTE
jgi:hypothetical protein